MYNIIILAAGIGSRLQPLTNHLPKALIKIHQKSVILYQLELLDKLTPNSTVYIVIGYLGNLIKQEVDRINSTLKIIFIENEDYKNTNNMYSLHLAMRKINEDYRQTIILNGDVIYDEKILKNFLSDSRKNLIAVDVGSYIKESMKVLVKEDLVLRITKDIPQEDAFGVSIDLYKLSIPSYLALRNTIQETIAAGIVKEWTEVAIDKILQTNEFPANVFNINRTPWYEIDTIDDLRVAEVIFNKDKGISEIINKKIFIFDLDGTLILGDSPTPGATEFIQFLHKNFKKTIIMTNNSSRGIEETRRLISSLMGIELKTSDIFSSTHATIEYLREKNIKKAFVVCTNNFIQDLEAEGFIIDDKDPEIIIVGYDTEISYEKLAKASLLIYQNINYIGTHSDLVCPTDKGLVPDAGSFLAFFQAATGKDPEIILGKPNPLFIKYISEKNDVNMEEIAVIGDRLYTDMRMGLEANCCSILLLTGETIISDLTTTPYLPHFVFSSLEEILSYWKRQIE